MANYIYISPLTAILATILAALWGMPVWLVVLSFFMTGSATALAIALVIFLFPSRGENDAPERADANSHRQSAVVDF